MRDRISITAVDARKLVPVSDEAGGMVVYVGGRAAFYVLNGEWFAALAEPVDRVPPTVVSPGPTAVSGARLVADQSISTSRRGFVYPREL